MPTHVPKFAVCLFASALAATAEPGEMFKKSPAAAKIESATLAEASGLAAATRVADAVWVINDGGSPAHLHLMGIDGSDRGFVAVEGSRNRDWEDLAGFTWLGEPHLLIAETGDNAAQYPTCSLIVVKEPAPPAAGKALAGTVTPAWTIEFRYPDGPRDCEAVAVDSAAKSILLLSKRDAPPRIYQLPLRPAGDGIQTATFLGTTEVKAPFSTLHPYGAQPTAMALAPDGRSAALLSYLGVFIFSRQAGETWQLALSRKPVMLEPHRLPQAEALTFSVDGRSLIAVSEGPQSPIVSYQLPRESP